MIYLLLPVTILVVILLLYFYKKEHYNVADDRQLLGNLEVPKTQIPPCDYVCDTCQHVAAETVNGGGAGSVGSCAVDAETFQPSANQNVLPWGVDSTWVSTLDYRCPNKVCKLATPFNKYAHEDDYNFWVNPDDSFRGQCLARELDPEFISSRQAMGACSGGQLSSSVYFDPKVDNLGFANDDLLDGDRYVGLSLNKGCKGSLGQSSIIELNRQTLGLSNPAPQGPGCTFIGSNGYKYKY